MGVNRAVPLAFLACAPWVAAWQPEPAATAHRYYQNQFDNLDPVKDGRLGVSRLETTERLGNDLAFHAPRVGLFDFGVAIFSSHGKPLDARTLRSRYVRGKSDAAKAATLAKKAADRFRRGDLAPLREKVADGYVEARPFVLSSEKCIKCHQRLKVGDAVAVGVYTVGKARAKG